MKKTILYTAIGIGFIKDKSLDAFKFTGLEAEDKESLIEIAKESLEDINEQYGYECKCIVLRITRTITLIHDGMEFTNEIYQLDYIGEIDSENLLMLEDAILDF